MTFLELFTEFTLFNHSCTMKINLSSDLKRFKSIKIFKWLSVSILALATALNISQNILFPQSSYAQQQLVGRPDVQIFIDELVKRHRLDRKSLEDQFAELRTDPAVLRLIQPVPPSARSWRVYRGNHVDAFRITEGRKFMIKHSKILSAAEEATGVPVEIITSILGIETNYGGNKGGFKVLRSLATLTFAFPDRADEFRPQLVDLFLLAREQNQPAGVFLGSYAGAMGYPQFLPSSWLSYGKDGDGDGRIDLINSVDDAIFSVGNYLKQHGWTSGGPVAVPVAVEMKQALNLRAAGDRPRLSQQQLLDAGVKVRTGSMAKELAVLVDLPTPGEKTDYWLGYPNFYSIMQYNRSFFYAMAVYQLAMSLAK